VAQLLPPLMLAKEWQWDNINPKGWWMSEKINGIRAYWNGNKLLSRQGNDFFPPKEFTEKFPQVAVDGELYSSDFTSLLNLSKNKDPQLWKNVNYHIFDIPRVSKWYEERQELLKQLKSELPSHVQIVPQKQCKGESHLKQYFQEIIDKGGEGVVLCKPKSMYQSGRSENCYKLKQYHDNEVKIIGVHSTFSGLLCEQ